MNVRFCMNAAMCMAFCLAQTSQAKDAEHADAVRTSWDDTFITSWNAFSKQFIDAPEFRLLPIPGSSGFRAVVRQGDHEWTVRNTRPILNLREIWDQVKVGKFTVTFIWDGAKEDVLRKETSERAKAPDFGGFEEPAMDWAAAADRNIALLVREAGHNTTAPYREPGVPVWIWAATPTYEVGYPCITINAVIWGLLAHVRNQGPQSADAMRLARVSADWALEHRQPEAGALPLFPFSTITKGAFGGSVEGESVNLLRASWLASVSSISSNRHGTSRTFPMPAISQTRRSGFRMPMVAFPTGSIPRQVQSRSNTTAGS